MNLRDRIDKAVKDVDKLFCETPKPPPGSTVQGLWDEILSLKKLVNRPKVQTAIRTLLEDPELESLNYDLIASIVRSGFEKRGFKCGCSRSSVSWYVSQKTLEWSIVPRGGQTTEL